MSGTPTPRSQAFLSLIKDCDDADARYDEQQRELIAQYEAKQCEKESQIVPKLHTFKKLTKLNVGDWVQAEYSYFPTGKPFYYTEGMYFRKVYYAQITKINKQSFYLGSVKISKSTNGDYWRGDSYKLTGKFLRNNEYKIVEKWNKNNEVEYFDI